MSLTVLMFHALYRTPEERAAVAAEERPYAIAADTLREALELIVERGGDLGGGGRDGPRVLLTFDDGHRSAYRHAFPILTDLGIGGVFFVTTDFIGARAGFCRWSELEEMAAAGMELGSHGVTHRFLDDLSEAEARRELIDSKRDIEDRTGAPVQSISFPGGRYRGRELELARAAGYRHCFSSRFGWHRPADELPFLVRRMALRAGMSAAQIAAYAMVETWPVLRARCAETAKSAARRMLGNRAYHALYRRWAGR